jgi:hypothetical protein
MISQRRIDMRPPEARLSPSSDLSQVDDTKPKNLSDVASVEPNIDREEKLKELVKENELVFREALQIFNDEADASEKKWLYGKYRRDQNRPPESLEGFVDFLYGANKRIINSPFEKLYQKVRGCESSLRHFCVVIDSLVRLVPDPAATPAGVACMSQYRELLGFLLT